MQAFRAELMRVPSAERDAWFDRVSGLTEIPDDGPDLPRGCVPYLPCPVGVLLRVAEYTGARATDVIVDVGSGVGRAAKFFHLLTGARVIGVEVQPHLARLARVETIEGDASALVVGEGTIFFLYCPFSGARLERLVDNLEPLARTRAIQVATVDTPLPARSWLTRVSPPDPDVLVYRSCFQ